MYFILIHIPGTENIPKWWIWAYWCSPTSYGQNAIAVNEFLAPRWNKVILSLCSLRVFLIYKQITMQLLKPQVLWE